MSWFCSDNPCVRDDCPFDLWAPSNRNKITNVAFSAYAFHQQEIEDFIDALAATPDPNDYSNQILAAQCAKLDPNSLTSDEIKYIEREVAKRFNGLF